MKQTTGRVGPGDVYEVTVASGHDFPLCDVTVRAHDNAQAESRAVAKAERVHRDRIFVAVEARKQG